MICSTLLEKNIVFFDLKTILINLFSKTAPPSLTILLYLFLILEVTLCAIYMGEFFKSKIKYFNSYSNINILILCHGALILVAILIAAKFSLSSEQKIVFTYFEYLNPSIEYINSVLLKNSTISLSYIEKKYFIILTLQKAMLLVFISFIQYIISFCFFIALDFLSKDQLVKYKYSYSFHIAFFAICFFFSIFEFYC